MKQLDKTNKILLGIIAGFLVVHLFGTNSKLLYTLNPDKLLRKVIGAEMLYNDEGDFIDEVDEYGFDKFSFTRLTEDTVTAMVFAIS